MKYLIGFVILILLALNVFFISVILNSARIEVATVIPTSTPTAEFKIIDSEKLFEIIQNWRTSEGLPKYEKNEQLCSIASDRADDPELDNHKGLYEKYSTLPFVVQENLAIGSDEKLVLTGWLQSPSHAETLRKPYAYSCVICKNNYCSQIFSNM